MVEKSQIIINEVLVEDEIENNINSNVYDSEFGEGVTDNIIDFLIALKNNATDSLPGKFKFSDPDEYPEFDGYSHYLAGPYDRLSREPGYISKYIVPTGGAVVHAFHEDDGSVKVFDISPKDRPFIIDKNKLTNGKFNPWG